MKNRESNSIDAQQDIAQFGKAARHPLCQAWLGQKRSQQRLLKLRKEAEELLEGLKHAQQIKKEAQGLLDKFYEERREDVIEALAVVQKVSAYPPKYQAAYETTVNLFDQWMAEAAPIFEGRFDRECDALAPGPAAKSEQALRALQTVKHRWNNPRPLKVGQRRELEIMKLVRQKASSAAAAKGG